MWGWIVAKYESYVVVFRQDVLHRTLFCSECVSLSSEGFEFKQNQSVSFYHVCSGISHVV
jgi:hypothetical protein